MDSFRLFSPFLLVFLCFFSDFTFSDIAGDRAALLRLRSAVRGNSLFWNLSDASPCSWTGVKCDHAGERVTMLRLPADGLSGKIPPNTIGNLTHLRVLSLRSNLLSGGIPPDFGSLSELEQLFLQNNRFSGNIPVSFFKLSNLIRLDISGNEFSGELFPFNNLTNLKIFHLQNNQFSGEIPNFNTNFSQFNISFNRLSGQIPAQLSTFPANSFAGNTQLCGPPLNPCPTQHKSNKLSAGAIAGITVGSFFGSILIITTIIILYNKHKRSQTSRTVSVDYPTSSSFPPTPEKTNFPTHDSVVVMDYTGSGYGYPGQEDNSDELVFFKGSGLTSTLSFLLDDLLRASAEMLGKGSVGTTYKAYLDDGIEVIVKRLRNVCVSEGEFRGKIALIGDLYHENLLPVRGFYYGREEKLVVFDYMPMGSLASTLHGKKESASALNWDIRSSIAFQVACGLQHLHSLNLFHGNIKSNNIFLTDEYEAFVSEFGLTQLVSPLEQNGYHPTDTRGTPQEADVYSFGVLILELITGKEPTDAMNVERIDLPTWVQSTVVEKWSVNVIDPSLLIDSNVEEGIVQLLRLGVRCVSWVPSKRPSMADVVRGIKKICGF